MVRARRDAVAMEGVPVWRLHGRVSTRASQCESVRSNARPRPHVTRHGRGGSGGSAAAVLSPAADVAAAPI